MGERHLFVLDASLFEVSDWNAVADTMSDLNQMGLARLPVPSCDIQIPTPWLLKGATKPDWAANPSTRILFEGVTLVGKRTHVDDLIVTYPDGSRRVVASSDADADWFRAAFSVTFVRLLVALATCNIEKTTCKGKRAKINLSTKSQYSHVTTLKVPGVQYLPNDPDRPPTGREVRAHFRRGFIRDQRYGKGRELVKKIWIDPVFVKADAGFVEQAKTYRLVA